MFSAISPTRFASLAAIISNGDAPLPAEGIAGIFFTAAAVAVVFLPTFRFVGPPGTDAAFLVDGIGRLVVGAFARDGILISDMEI
jgi:hypothetical protein